MKDVVGYEGLYAVTSCGKVWSYKYKKFLSPRDNGHGYECVCLTNSEGKRGMRRVHILVAQAYIPNPEGKSDVGHLDDCRNHNWVGNLKWMTRSENLDTDHYREAVKNKKFTKVRCVETGEVFNSQAHAAREMNIGRYNINNVLLGKQHTAGGYHWERVEEGETA